MAVEGFENRSHKPVCQQHARGGDINDRNALFGRDGLEKIAAMWDAGCDAGAFTFRVARVQDEDWNVLLNGGQYGCRMQHFCAEVSEFSGFIETDGFDTSCLGT